MTFLPKHSLYCFVLLQLSYPARCTSCGLDQICTHYQFSMCFTTANITATQLAALLQLIVILAGLMPQQVYPRVIQIFNKSRSHLRF